MSYVKFVVPIGENCFCDCRDIMSCITLSSNIEGIASKGKFRVVSEEVVEEVIKMFGCIFACADLLGSIVVGKACSDWLIDAHDVSFRVPAPCVLCCFQVTRLSFDIDWSDFVEASELAGGSRSTLQPDDQRYGFILPRESISLPEGIVYGCHAIIEIPIDIFVA